MPTFYFRAIDRGGNLQEGTVAAGAASEVRDGLKARSLLPIEIAEAKKPEAPAPIRASGPATGLRFGGVSDRELSALAWQLHTMLGAALPLVKSLELLSRQTRNEGLRDALETVAQNVARGEDFSEAIARRPDLFSPMFAAMVETGEVTGTLDTTMMRLAEHLDRKCDLRDKITTALAYPVVVLCMAIAVSIFLVVFVLPKLSAVFADSGTPLPPLTSALLGGAAFIASHWLALSIAIALLGFALWRFAESDTGRRVLHQLVLKLPLIGPLVLKSIMMQITQTLATLQAAGISLTASLALVEKGARNVAIVDALRRLQSSIVAGETLSAEMARSPLFPELVASMVSVGEETGALPDMLQRVAAVYVKEVELEVGAFTRVIEPVLLVAMTVVVGVIAAAIYLPIADISSTVAK
ncbi:MAG: type II secretion system F family protein [Candidatus Wallbacteria bacterium]|nr:type II secretion system F family protein [Candidatus Wallbacteria bacterium]